MAKLPLDYHPDARAEADAAFDYYRERSPMVAEAFYRELEKAQASIQDSPESWATYLHDTRRFLLDRFPFVIVYHLAEQRIEIVAVAHGYRRPGYWAGRLT